MRHDVAQEVAAHSLNISPQNLNRHRCEICILQILSAVWGQYSPLKPRAILSAKLTLWILCVRENECILRSGNYT